MDEQFVNLGSIIGRDAELGSPGDVWKVFETDEALDRLDHGVPGHGKAVKAQDLASPVPTQAKSLGAAKALAPKAKTDRRKGFRAPAGHTVPAKAEDTPAPPSAPPKEAVSLASVLASLRPELLRRSILYPDLEARTALEGAVEAAGFDPALWVERILGLGSLRAVWANPSVRRVAIFPGQGTLVFGIGPRPTLGPTVPDEDEADVALLIERAFPELGTSRPFVLSREDRGLDQALRFLQGEAFAFNDCLSQSLSEGKHVLVTAPVTLDVSLYLPGLLRALVSANDDGPVLAVGGPRTLVVPGSLAHLGSPEEAARLGLPMAIVPEAWPKLLEDLVDLGAPSSLLWYTSASAEARFGRFGTAARRSVGCVIELRLSPNGPAANVYRACDGRLRLCEAQGSSPEVADFVGRPAEIVL